MNEKRERKEKGIKKDLRNEKTVPTPSNNKGI